MATSLYKETFINSEDIRDAVEEARKRIEETAPAGIVVSRSHVYRVLLAKALEIDKEEMIHGTKATSRTRD